MSDLQTTSLLTPAPAQRTVFQQFPSGHGYEKFEGTGTLSDDTSDFVVGTQSLKFLFVWPKGSFTASQMPLALEFFNAIRGTTGGKGGAAGAQETFPPGENGRLRSWLVGNTATAAEVEAALTQCSTNKSWLILTFHRIVASGASEGTECNEATFKEMIDKVKASGLAVKTVAEVLES
jgi:hypothetical protein